MVSQVQLAAQSRLWIGKDYNNFVLKDLTNLDDPFEGTILGLSSTSHPIRFCLPHKKLEIFFLTTPLIFIL